MALSEYLRRTRQSSRYLEGVLGDGFDHLLERHLGGESVAVVDDRFSFISVPAVQLHAAAALDQSPAGRETHSAHILLCLSQGLHNYRVK